MEQAFSDTKHASPDIEMVFDCIKQTLGCGGSSTPTHPGGLDVCPKNSRSCCADRRRGTRGVFRSDCTDTRRMSGLQRWADLRRDLIAKGYPEY
jgi:hypothetical protein